jgi:hypothetical protein
MSVQSETGDSDVGRRSEVESVSVEGPAGELRGEGGEVESAYGGEPGVDFGKKGIPSLSGSLGSGWFGRDWLCVGICPKCGAPIYARGLWENAEVPPASHHSCGCFERLLASIPARRESGKAAEGESDGEES